MDAIPWVYRIMFFPENFGLKVILVSLFHNFAHNTVIKNTNYQWAWEVEEETMYQQIKKLQFSYTVLEFPISHNVVFEKGKKKQNALSTPI